MMVRSLIVQMKQKHLITAKQAIYLYGPDLPRARLFYLLPKIHKAPENWTIPFLVPPGHPIVSDCGSESYRLAEFIDYFINPLSHTHPSYVKDTYTFVNKLKHLTVPENTFIFSIDKSEMEFNHFIHILNSHHRIKLKHTLHLHQQVPFLDTIVFFTDARDGYKTLANQVYFKDTDRHSLIFNSSYHP